MTSLEGFDSLRDLPEGKKIYFASDFHLGAPNTEESLVREKRIIRWLEQVEKDASAIFFVGDVFDFWFEYKHVIPKGFIRFQGKIASIVDSGISIFLFTGNHDLWYSNYFTDELGIPIIRQPVSVELGKRTFYIGHGDGLGKGDNLFKAIKKVFTSKVSQYFFRWLHPDIGMYLAKKWSARSRNQSKLRDEKFLGEQEVLYQFSQKLEAETHHDFYIFGHRHMTLEMKLTDNATYFNLGEWFKENSYLEFDGEKATLLYYS